VSEDAARAALERLLAAAEARLPTVPGEGSEPIRFGLLSARFVADECRKGLGAKVPASGKSRT
jgi:hypothetical protein